MRVVAHAGVKLTALSQHAAQIDALRDSGERARTTRKAQAKAA